MSEPGPYVRWSDPRLYELVSKDKHWNEVQKSLLLGTKSWFSARNGGYRKRDLIAIQKYLHDRNFSIDEVVSDGVRCADISLVGLPSPDQFLKDMIEQYALKFDHIQLLRLSGPLENAMSATGEPVYLFSGIVFGTVRDVKLERRIGLVPVYIISKLGVFEIERFQHNGGIVVVSQVGSLGYEASHIRVNLRKGRRTMKRIAAALPDWKAYQSRLTEEAEAEAARVKAESDQLAALLDAQLEDEELMEDLASFRP